MSQHRASRMNQARKIVVEAPDQTSAARPSLASWYTPGFSDGLGDRLLMFDNTAAASLELLRFKPEFGDQPAFERTLRRRLKQLDGFSHPSVARARSVDWLGAGEGLALVSNHVEGRRLSEVIGEARGPSFAMQLLEQLTPAIATLQEYGQGIAHGALSADRIVVTPEGRLIVVEHVVGPALEALRLPAHRLQSELGIPVPAGHDTLVLDPRADVVQLAFVALSLLIGRPVDPADYPDQGAELLDEFSWSNGHGPSASRRLRAWLERALQLNEQAFATAREAHDAFAGLSEDYELPMASQPRMIHAIQAPPEPVHGALAPALAAPPDPAKPIAAPALRPSAAQWVIAALAVLAVTEGLAIAGLVYSQRAAAALPPTANPDFGLASTAVRAANLRDGAAAGAMAPAGADSTLEVQSDPPGAKVIVDGKTGGWTPLTMSIGAGSHTVVMTDGQSTTTRILTTHAGRTSTLVATFSPAGTTAAGWLSISAPIELQVREGGSILGITSADRLMLPAGRHDLEIVSAALGFQQRLSVDIQRGKTVRASVTVPNGSLSINAVPWANVWLDGRPLGGTTPFANLTVPLGTHELVYRHPQLGERRETVTVTAKAPVRLVTDLRK